MQKIALLGATGSIGRQTLDVVRECLPHAKVTALTAFSNVAALAPLVDEFKPEMTWVPDDAAAAQLAEMISVKCEILTGDDGLTTCAAQSNADVVVNALVGCAGLAPTLAAIEAGKNIALANKETLVTAGGLVMNLAREKNVRITPIDSEHSAIWQCLQGNDENDIEKIILTASGGPFRTWPREKIATTTAADALRHPNWNMGAKITVDCATMMNKGLELIEAMWLFSQPIKKATPPLPEGSVAGVCPAERRGTSGKSGAAKAAGRPGCPGRTLRVLLGSATDMGEQRWNIATSPASSRSEREGLGQSPIAHENIEIVVHPQSIIHSMVQFTDGAVMAQMGLPDMRLPILYALAAPKRVKTTFPRMDFLTCGSLTFEPPDTSKFPCLTLAQEAARVGGTLPAVMNYINEWAVGEFLHDKIGFYDISDIIAAAFGAYTVKPVAGLDDIREAEAWAAEFVKTCDHYPKC